MDKFDKKILLMGIAEAIVIYVASVMYTDYKLGNSEQEFKDKVVSVADHSRFYKARIEKEKAQSDNFYNARLAFIDSLVAHKNDSPDSLSNYVNQLTTRTTGHIDRQWIYDITKGE